MKNRIYLFTTLCLFFATVVLKAQDSEILNRFPIMNGDSLKGYCFAYKELKAEKNRDKYIFTIYNKDMVQSDGYDFLMENDFTLDYYTESMEIKRQIEIKGNFLFLVFHKSAGSYDYLGKNKNRIVVIDLIKRETISDKIIEDKDDAGEENKFIFLENNRIFRVKKGKIIEFFDYSLNKINDIIIPNESNFKSLYISSTSFINKDFLAVILNGYVDKKIVSLVWIISIKDGKILKKIDFLTDEKDCFYTVSKLLTMDDSNEFFIIGSYAKYNGKKAMFGFKLSDPLAIYIEKVSVKNNGEVSSVKKNMPFSPFFDHFIFQTKFGKSEYPTSIDVDKVFVNENKYCFVFKTLKAGVNLYFGNGGIVLSTIPLPKFEGEQTVSSAVKNSYFIFEADAELNLSNVQKLSGDKNIENVSFDSEKEFIIRKPSIFYNNINGSLTILSSVIGASNNSNTSNGGVVMPMSNSKISPNTPFHGDKFISILSEKGKPLKSDEFSATPDAEWTEFYPAKPGYILIVEYFKKEKALKKRIEKLNY